MWKALENDDNNFLPVYLPLMVDLDIYFNFSTNRTKPAKFCKQSKLLYM